MTTTIAQIHETYVNETEHVRFGESGWFEPFTGEAGKLFRDLQREYGRCVSSMYRDTRTATLKVGWVFSKRMRYEDARGNDPVHDFYTREVWVEYRTPVQAEVARVREFIDAGGDTYDEAGEPVVAMATCGVCGRSWNDAKLSSLTPVPAGRCPFEYAHNDPEEARL